jgi:hypothetical protein
MMQLVLIVLTKGKEMIHYCEMFGYSGTMLTTKNIVIGCTISEAVHLEPLLDHISTVVQDLNHC